MGYEDVDYCLRAWEEGRAVRYEPGLDAHPPRVAHPRHRAGRARARLPGALLGALGELVRRAPGAHRRRRAADHLRDRGHRRRRRPPRHLRAPQPPGGARARRGAVLARGGARVVPARGATCARSRTTRSSPRALAEEDAIKVATWWGTGPAGVARLGAARAGRSSSSRTSRPPTTPDDYRAVLSRRQVLAGYREEFRLHHDLPLDSQERLKEIGLRGRADPARHRPRQLPRSSARARSEDTMLALGRDQPPEELPAHGGGVGAPRPAPAAVAVRRRAGGGRRPGRRATCSSPATRR